MIKQKCSVCENNFPQGDMFKLKGKIICKACLENYVKTSKNITDEDIEKCIDKTVCLNCGKDNGNISHNLIGNLPYCPECTLFVKNRPFPQWIKLASLAIFIILIASMSWNYRFYKGFKNFKDGINASANGNFVEASVCFENATKFVPEDKNLKSLNNYFKGIKFLYEDNSKSALECFQSVDDNIPQPALDYLIKQSKLGIAFDNKDYDKFLELAFELREINPNDPILIGQISSAYACKYATTSQQQYYQKSIQYLDSARIVSNNSTEFKEYEDRILHRLATKIIITKDDFIKLYPNGWKQGREN